MAWADNYNKLVEKKIPAGDYKEWRFVLEEHKTRGTMQVNVRMWQLAKEEGGYEGPTKSGFIYKIKTPDDIDDLEKTFIDDFANFFKDVREMI